jgi:DNA-binding PadR family transcriptional regulator
MLKDAALYDLTQNAQGMIFQAAFQHFLSSTSEEERARQPEAPLLMQLRRGYAESPHWMMVQAQEFYPEPLTVETFRKRAVYSAPGLVYAILEFLASEKLLDRRGEAYHLTESGLEVVAWIKWRRTQPFASFEPILRVEIERLEALMRRVIDASLHSDDPPGVWCLEHSRRRSPEDGSLVAKIVHYSSDFNAFRDDCHKAAYRPYTVPGHTWEAFSFVDDGKAATAEGLFDQLAYRGFARGDWEESLGDLVNRGWLEISEGQHHSTDKGKAVRNAVEAQTDAYFYAPWDCLSERDFHELWALLQKIHNACQALLTDVTHYR